MLGCSLQFRNALYLQTSFQSLPTCAARESSWELQPAVHKSVHRQNYFLQATVCNATQEFQGGSREPWGEALLLLLVLLQVLLLLVFLLLLLSLKLFCTFGRDNCNGVPQRLELKEESPRRRPATPSPKP